MRRSRFAEGKSNQISSSTTEDAGTAIQNKGEGNTHEHFTIRGYVAKMREKDIKLCEVFPSEPLPPLEVPKFRFWRCLECVMEITQSYKSGGCSNMAVNLHEQNNFEYDENQYTGMQIEESAKVDTVAMDVEKSVSRATADIIPAVKDVEARFPALRLVDIPRKIRSRTPSHVPQCKHRKVHFLTDRMTRNDNAEIEQAEVVKYIPLPTWGRRKKRKTPLRSVREMLPPNNQARVLQGDTDSRNAIVIISDSGSEDDACTGSGLKSFKKTGETSCTLKLMNKLPGAEIGQPSDMNIDHWWKGEVSSGKPWEPVLSPRAQIMRDLENSIARMTAIMRQQMSGERTQAQGVDQQKGKMTLAFDVSLPDPNDEAHTDCQLSKNPADFCHLEESSEHMIPAEDLRFMRDEDSFMDENWHRRKLEKGKAKM